MKYDSESGRIKLGCREFVGIARRGISPTLTFDDSEPKAHMPSRAMLEIAVGERFEESVDHDFEICDQKFTLHTMVEKTDLGELLFYTEVDSNPERPRKEYITELRAEAYISTYIYALKHSYVALCLRFCYINSSTAKYKESFETVSIDVLKKFFDKCAKTVSVYARPEVERVTKRLPTMKALKFPYATVRDGQSRFIRTAYKTIARGGTLFATAPTGTGKTISALFPAIRTLGEGLRDKIFYLTPKETTTDAAISSIRLVANSGVIIRAIKITAKEKTCKKGLLCKRSRELCEASRSNNISDAVLALYDLEKTIPSSDELNSVAEQYNICPYELELAYAELCDIVICDFNYLFDPAVYIRRFFTEGGNYVFLIDEAHNLPDRAREMYSAEFSTDDFELISKSDLLGEFSESKKITRMATESFFELLYEYLKEDMITDDEGTKKGAAHTKEPPPQLFDMFDTLIGTAENEIFTNFAASDEEKSARLKLLYDYYYKLKKFKDVLENFDNSYEMFIFCENTCIRTKLYCIDTGKQIRHRLELGAAAIFFSATLTPIYYYKSLLGGNGSSDMLDVDSPFDTSQLSINIIDKISTRFSERDKTLLAVCRTIAATVSAKRGNYIIFSPSFAYSEALAQAFKSAYPKIRVLTQSKNMTQAEKKSFLDEFSKEDKSYLIGFCVMGGIYAEGIDLAGDALIGAVVVGIGMPGLSYEREAIQAYFDEKYEEGKQFAYIYPGMNRVLQAAGRVIRREDDKGVIVLIDDRFADPIYKKIIPTLWRDMKFIDSAKALREELDIFWNDNKKE